MANKLQPKVNPRRILPKIRPVPVKPLPGPVPIHPHWTPERLKIVIEQAVLFIVAARERHADQLAFEVGEYLFYKVYMADEAYIRLKHRSKTASLRDIAEGTGIVRETLANWLRASIIRIRIREAGFDPELLHSHYLELDRLHEHIEAAGVLATWADDHDLSVDQLSKLARKWKQNLDKHGTIEDLVKKLDPDPPPKPPKPRKRRATTAQLEVPRLLGLVLRWIRITALTGQQRQTLKKQLLEMRAAITGGQS